MSYIDTYTQLVGTPAFENTIPWLYLDSDAPPNATTACGLLVAGLGASQALPWCNPDWTPADEAAIAADWHRVTMLPGSKVAGFYHSAQGLQLSQVDILNITRAKVVQCDTELAASYSAYDFFPDCVKIALLDMVWNLGISKLRSTYPHFNVAVSAQDWKTAAAQCGRNVNVPAFAPRNAWTVAQFNQAVNA
jgi:hypothetical protein